MNPVIIMSVMEYLRLAGCVMLERNEASQSGGWEVTMNHLFLRFFVTPLH